MIGCPCNKNVNDLHQQFNDILNTYLLDKKYIAPLKAQLKYTFEYFTTSNEDNIAYLKYNLKTINNKVNKIEERFVIGEIDDILYQKFSQKYNDLAITFLYFTHENLTFKYLKIKNL